MTMKETFTLVATAAAGLEAVVGRELRELGYETQVENGKVRFQGDVRAIAETNLWLRAADRIKIVVGEFPARTFEELFQGVFALDWENYLPLGAKFPISKAKCVKSKLHNEPSVQAISKKAVVKKLQKYFHRPEGVPLQETGAEFKIEVSILKDKATVLIDTTGASLFKRGYRTDKGGAPIKENMAAAILELSNWYPDKPLIDPTCGSGTFCIEAAMIGMNIAPGFNRDFAFEAWNWVGKDLVQSVRDEADSKANYDVALDIMGCDIDSRMVEIAKANAREAGLEDVVKFKQMRLQDLKTDKINGVIISNPPYGERLLDDKAVDILYNEMGQTFAPLKTWSKFILTSDEQFESKYGMKADKKRKLYNGTLRVDLYQYFGERVRRSEARNGYEGSQELDFQDAKEMTVGEAVRKEAEINAGVTETDSILDKYIKQHREEVTSQKFSKKIEADGDTSPLDAFIQKQRQEFADSGLIGQTLANESTNSTTADETVTPITSGFGTTETKADDTQAPVDSEITVKPESESSETIITSTNADRFITSEAEKFDLGEALTATTTSTNQQVDNTAMVDNVDDPEPESTLPADDKSSEPQASKPLLEDVGVSETIDSDAIATTVAGVTGVKADEAKATPKVSMTVSRPSAEDKISSGYISPSHKGVFDGDIPVYRRKGVVIGALTVIALAIIGGSYALYKVTHSQSAKTTSTASSAVISSSSKGASASDNKAFEDMYKNFFTDDEQTKLANDQFGKLSDLEKLLKKLEKTKYYDAAKTKYDNLKKQIEAIEKVNSKYESDALVDGSYNASISVKSDANFNDLSERVTNTGNASLDSIIQEVIKGGKTQLEEKGKAASATSAVTASESVNTATPSGDNTSGAANSGVTGAAGGVSSGTAATSTVVTRGIMNYNPSILQRDRSRVPYNANVVADTSNPAWTWADGVLDKIIATSHSRGYFSGDNFILEPVNIINGNGYYNMYLPDGTYLFSINCKTGYYVGNGSGHSDKLDY